MISSGAVTLGEIAGRLPMLLVGLFPLRGRGRLGYTIRDMRVGCPETGPGSRAKKCGTRRRLGRIYRVRLSELA
jgi:hypothetical protein